ncbi:methyltransferase [Flavisolibacter sp. BT320]|nr:methyltransferase [Flavisolibacter longurius]
MANPYFRFKQFTVYHDRCAMKVTTDACLFGAWTAETINNEQLATGDKRFLDVGTGTGLLSLMVAQKNNGKIDAVEIDAGAAVQAAENIKSSPWQDAIQVIQQDVLQWQQKTKYDVILSNPPFYENEIRSETEEKNVAHHGEGLRLEELLLFIKRNIKEDGTFFLLLPAKRKSEMERLMRKQELYAEKLVMVQQTQRHQPFRIMLQGRCQKVNEICESLISIKNSEDAYTPEFISLLKSYYLYL